MHCLYKQFRLSKYSNSYYRISWKFCWVNFSGATLFSRTFTNNNIGHLDELLIHVSTAAVICGSDALENQHSTYLRSTEQDILFKQPQNSSPKRKRDAYRKRVKTSERLKFHWTSCEKNQNTECQSEYNKGMRPGWPAGFSLIHKCLSEMHCLAGKGMQNGKENGSFRMHMVGW